MLSAFQYQFMQNAFIASLLVSVVCGIMGVVIMEKKLVMISGGIAHTSYGGVGLGYLLGFEPIIGAFFVSVCAALGIAVIKRKAGTRADIITGLFWSLGMALGILFIGLSPGYPPDLSSYLFGSILTVTRFDILIMTVLTVIIAAAFIMYFNYWKAYLFDEEYTSILGIKTRVLEYALFILIAVAVVVLIRAVGIVLVLALFTAPAAIAEIFSSRFGPRIVYSVLLSALFCFAGLVMSYYLDIASGASIVVVSAVCYLFAYVIKSLGGRKQGSWESLG